jgi:hypothetical protein
MMVVRRLGRLNNDEKEMKEEDEQNTIQSIPQAVQTISRSIARLAERRPTQLPIKGHCIEALLQVQIIYQLERLLL